MEHHHRAMGLDGIRERIRRTDLCDSIQPILSDLDRTFSLLETQGITTLEKLRGILKNAKSMAACSSATGIEMAYLVLLRREINGWERKDVALRELHWVDPSVIADLERAGITTLGKLHALETAPQGTVELPHAQDRAYLLKIFAVTRIRWASLDIARALVDAGYDSAEKVARGDAATLGEVLATRGPGGRRIGLRDVRRLIAEAHYAAEGGVASSPILL